MATIIDEVDDLAIKILDVVLDGPWLPEGGTAVDSIIRLEGGIRIEFSGVDESGDKPRRYNGFIRLFRGDRAPETGPLQYAD